MTTTLLRVEEVVAALSLATDLGTGASQQRALRSCLLGMRLADLVGHDAIPRDVHQDLREDAQPDAGYADGQMKVGGFRHMGTFSKLMPPETDEMSLPINVTEPETQAATA